MVAIVIAIIITIAILAVISLYAYFRVRTLSDELLNKGLTLEETTKRNEYLRKAALLFNENAILAYACNNPDMFVKPKMQPFNYSVGWHRFPCIFADHYFAKGLKKWISGEQKAFMKRVYAFEGLEEDCDDLIEQAINKLNTKTNDVVIVFMPCSNFIRFNNKFQHLCWKLQRKGYNANHLTYPVLSIRDHITKDTNSDELMSHVGRIIGIEKRKVIVIDDIFNTGKTLTAFAKELKKCKAQLVGAVFVSKVFYPPTNMLAAWLKILFSPHR